MICYQTPYRPEDVNYDGSRFEVLNKHFEKMIEKDQLQGATYCLSRDGKVFANAAIGRYCYRPEDTRELTPDHLHHIASITKLFTAVAIFKLYEDGRLLIGQKVSEILEEFKEPPYNNITIGQLLTHTSGMQPDPNCFPSPYFQSNWDHVAEGFKAGDSAWLKNGLKAGLRTAPGTEWAYSSFGFAILGEIITRVSGTIAHQYIKDNIIQPCEMESTNFMENFTKEELLQIVLHDEEDEKMHNAVKAGQTSDFEEFEEFWKNVPNTAGGLLSTASDLNKFGTMLLQNGTYNGKRIVSRKAIEKMTTLAIDSSVPDYCWEAGGVFHPYGLGPDLRCDWNNMFTPGSFFHEGAGSSSLVIDPKEKLVAAWFVPYTHNAWYADGLYNAANIMWSGLL